MCISVGLQNNACYALVGVGKVHVWNPIPTVILSHVTPLHSQRCWNNWSCLILLRCVCAPCILAASNSFIRLGWRLTAFAIVSH